MATSKEIYTIRKDVLCLECGGKGAVKYSGTYYPVGMKDELDKYPESIQKIYAKHRDQCYVSPAAGFGGTIPHECLNCGNTGLIDMNGLEGYKRAFVTFGDKEKADLKVIK